MARWQRHFIEIGRVPRRHDNASVFRSVLDLFDAFRQLIHALSGVVGMHVHVLGSKVAPLKAVDGSQIAHFSMRKTLRIEEFSRTIAIPNINVLGRQIVRIGIPLGTKK